MPRNPPRIYRDNKEAAKDWNQEKPKKAHEFKEGLQGAERYKKFTGRNLAIVICQGGHKI